MTTIPGTRVFTLLIVVFLALFILSGMVLAKPSVSQPLALDGSFFQPSLVLNWTDADFSAEYDAMKEVGMTHIIWQSTVDSKELKAYYPTKMAGFTMASSADLVDISLQEAEKKGLHVWLGLNWNDDWFKYYAKDEKRLLKEESIAKEAAKELWQRYGKKYNSTIAGFYLPMEVDNVHFRSDKQQERMAGAYKDVIDSIHRLTSKPVMISPFFNEKKGQNAQQYADMWGRILKAAAIDVIALQDGIGCGHSSLESVGTWLSAMDATVKKVRPATQLWSNVELYTPQYEPAPLDRVIQQMNGESKYITNFTCFSFNHYYSRHNGHVEQFFKYRDYINSVRNRLL